MCVCVCYFLSNKRQQQLVVFRSCTLLAEQKDQEIGLKQFSNWELYDVAIAMR